MKSIFFAIFAVLGCACILQTGCQEPAKRTQEPKPTLIAPVDDVSTTKTETSTEPNGPAPKIMFEKVVHDFGQVGPGTKNTCEFKFTNTGDGLLKVKKKIWSGCGCTVPQLSKQEYALGESGIIKVTYNAGTRPGKASKSLRVSSNDKTNPKVELKVKANIVLKVNYEPKRLKLFPMKENAGCPEIILTSVDNQPFAIKSFNSRPEGITADFDVSQKATKFVVQPKVDVGKLKDNSKGHIHISLTHPQCKKITIGFNVVPEFVVKPPSIILLAAEPQVPMTRQVWLLNNYDQDFEIQSATSEKGIIKVLSQSKVGKRYKFELEITPPAIEGNTKYFNDKFIVNISDDRKVEISCRGFYSKKKKTDSGDKS